MTNRNSLINWYLNLKCMMFETCNEIDFLNRIKKNFIGHHKNRHIFIKQLNISPCKKIPSGLQNFQVTWLDLMCSYSGKTLLAFKIRRLFLWWFHLLATSHFSSSHWWRACKNMPILDTSREYFNYAVWYRMHQNDLSTPKTKKWNRYYFFHKLM